MKNKLLKNFCIIFTLIIAISSFASCDAFDTGLESGFDTSGGCESDPFMAAYKSDKSKFDINDVTLEFYYGSLWGNDVSEESYRPSWDIPGFDLYFEVDENKYFVKHSEDNLISDKYGVDLEYYEKYGEYRANKYFRHSEILTIPKGAFENESGSISFMVYGTNIKDRAPEYKNFIRTDIYYKRSGDQVTLSDRPFK